MRGAISRVNRTIPFAKFLVLAAALLLSPLIVFAECQMLATGEKAGDLRRNPDKSWEYFGRSQ